MGYRDRPAGCGELPPADNPQSEGQSGGGPLVAPIPVGTAKSRKCKRKKEHARSFGGRCHRKKKH
jgi:hypothetical protein